MPMKHAVLSASASHRWLECPAAPRFEEQFPPSTSVYAEEGTLAHSICELMARKRFTVMSRKSYTEELTKLQAHELYQDEMLKTAEFYVEFLDRAAMTYAQKPHVTMEVEVDLSEWVPEGFGTCDCAMIGGDTLHITDYKHGKGEIVSALGNTQMRLYGLGALKKYSPIYGNAIKRVVMAIVQPRVTEDVSEETLTVEELLAWGETVKPIAQLAFAGLGGFHPGPHCRFCRGRAQCAARAAVNTALEEFKGCVPAGSLPPDQREALELLGGGDSGGSNLLTDAQVGDLLIRGAQLVQWYNDLQAYALEALLAGREIPGYKVVAGRSNRAFADVDKALETLEKAGYDQALLYERKPKTLSELEKMLGKKTFAELLGAQVVKPQGKPTLTEISDKREAYSPAAADFAGVAQ